MKSRAARSHQKPCVKEQWKFSIHCSLSRSIVLKNADNALRIDGHDEKASQALSLRHQRSFRPRNIAYAEVVTATGTAGSLCQRFRCTEDDRIPAAVQTVILAPDSGQGRRSNLLQYRHESRAFPSTSLRCDRMKASYWPCRRHIKDIETYNPTLTRPSRHRWTAKAN